MNMNSFVLLKHLQNGHRLQPIWVIVYPRYRAFQVAHASRTTEWSTELQVNQGNFVEHNKMHIYRVSENL